MALDQAANFVREEVTSTINAGDTTVDVTDASDFPIPPEGYNIVVWDAGSFARPDQDSNVEIMRVTDVDATNDVLTVARGQEGTSDVQHPDTSVVVVAQTAKMIADIASEKISNPVTETVNADGNDVTNVGALDAQKINNDVVYDNISDASTTRYGDALSNGRGGINYVQPNTTVGTSATTILTTEINPTAMGLVIVGGYDVTNDAHFVDILSHHRTGNLTTILGSEERDGPAGRSYSGSGDDLQLAMSNGESDVTARAVGVLAIE